MSAPICPCAAPSGHCDYPRCGKTEDKSKAMQLAEALDELDAQFSRSGLCGEAAAELRRLHAENEALRADASENLALFHKEQSRSEALLKCLDEVTADKAALIRERDLNLDTINVDNNIILKYRALNAELVEALQAVVQVWFRKDGINYVDFGPYMDAARAVLAKVTEARDGS